MKGDRAAEVYGLHGLRLRSPVPLAGLLGTGDEYDLDVTWRTHDGPVPGEAPPGRLVAAAAAGDGAYLYVATGDDGAGDGPWRLRVPGLCDFVIDQGLARIECQVDPSSDERFVSVLVAGLGVSFILGLAGHCVLHASAVSVEGVAVAFAGHSGAGKSTLTSLLCAAGAAMVTDDVLRIGLRPGGPVCVGGAPEIRLRQGAVWALDEYASAPAARVTADDRLAVSPSVETAAETRLGLVVLPRLSREATAVELRPVTGARAVASLASVCRVTGWKDPDIMRRQFGTVAELAATVPVREAVIPWGPHFRSAIAPAFLDFVRGR